MHRHNLAEGEGIFPCVDGFVAFVEAHVAGFLVSNKRKSTHLWQAHFPYELHAGPCLWPISLTSLDEGRRRQEHEEDARPDGKPSPQRRTA